MALRIARSYFRGLVDSDFSRNELGSKSHGPVLVRHYSSRPASSEEMKVVIEDFKVSSTHCFIRAASNFFDQRDSNRHRGSSSAASLNLNCPSQQEDALPYAEQS